MKKKLKDILEALQPTELEMTQKMKQVSDGLDNVKNQLAQINSMWQKKLITDEEYRKRVEALTKQMNVKNTTQPITPVGGQNQNSNEL